MKILIIDEDTKNTNTEDAFVRTPSPKNDVNLNKLDGDEKQVKVKK